MSNPLVSDVNPLKTDPDLVSLLKGLDKVKKYKSFQRWKSKFLDRLESFLYEKGMKPADKACTDFGALLKKFVVSATKVQDFIAKGELSDEKKTVKASLALNEMCSSLTTVWESIDAVIPMMAADEKKRGYTKFHLGACLIRQGFYQYLTMKVIDDALVDIGAKLKTVADRQQHDLFAQYRLTVERFCDVMADLHLYEIMLKCIQFLEAPEEEESSEEEEVTIKITIHSHDGKILTLVLDPTDTIGNVKAAIANGCGIPPDKQVLQFDGKDLAKSDATLASCGIQEGSKLTVEPFRVAITVNTMDGKQIKVMVDPSDRLSDIKVQLEEETGVPARNQALFMNGEELADPNKTADEYGIRSGSVLDLEPKTISITIKTPDGKSIQVQVRPSDTAEEIKEKIAAQVGMKVPQQILKFNGNEMKDGTTVKSMGIQEGSEIMVDIFRVPVTVNTMDGKSIKIMIDPTDYLSDIKRQLEEECGILAKNQTLSMNGEELSDPNKTASEYGIKAGSILDLEPTVMAVNVTTPDGKTYRVEVSPSDTAEVVKEKISKITGMPVPKQVIKHKGTEFANGKTVKDMHIIDGSDLTIEIFKIPVTVNTMDGKSIKVMIDPSDRISDIKVELQEKTGVPAINQKLFLGDNELSDPNKTAGDYGVEPGSVLDLEPSIIKVNVTTPDGKLISVEVKSSDTAEDVKAKIAKQTGMNVPQQVLLHQGKEFANGKTIKDMGIQDGSDLKVEIFKVPITVNTMDGKSIKVMIDPTNKISDIKMQLEKETGLSATNQKLSMDGQEISDPNKTASDYGIKSGSVLDLEPSIIKVNVTTPDGKKITIEVKPTDTAEDIKATIAKQTGMNVPQQVLLHQGKEFANGKTIKDMGIQDGSDLKVEIFKVPITVKMMDGKSIQVMIDPTNKISDIKMQLEKETGVSATNQKLSMDGQEISDPNKTASDYGIKSGSVLDLEPSIIKVNVTTPDGKQITIEVKPTDTAEVVKGKIAKLAGMNVPQQMIMHQGKEFANGKTIKDMGIQDGSDLIVEIFKVPITVNTMDGKSIKVMIDPTNKISDIKVLLEKESGVAANNQKLSMNGQDLSDSNKSASDYGVKKGSVLDLQPKIIKVTVETPDGKKHEIELESSDTADSIKAKVAQASGMTVPRQVLKVNGKEIPKGKTVGEMGIREGSNINVDIFKIPITVKTPDGKKISLAIEPGDSVDRIKKLIETEYGMDAKKQVIKLAGKELKGSSTAKECGIESGTVLDLEQLDDPIIFVDIKSGSLFAMERDDVIAKEALKINQNNKLDFVEATKDAATKDRIAQAMKSSPKLGVSNQVVVTALAVDDYDLEEAEKVKGVWGVSLKKREKNKKGEEFLFVDPKTGQCGELSRAKYIEMKFITPMQDAKGETIAEREKDHPTYDRYVSMIRGVFNIKFQ